MSKPLAFFYHSSQPNILYYNNDYSIHMLNKKHANVFFHFGFSLKKREKKAKLKYFSKKYGLKHGEQDISQTT